MLAEGFTLLLRLPPLAFGPALPPRAFDLPRVLVCDIHQLGRIREAVPSRFSQSPGPSLNSNLLRPAQEIHLVNGPVDMLLLLTVAYVGRASWDSSTWADRAWQSTGGVTPVLVPPMAPPAWGSGRR